MARGRGVPDLCTSLTGEVRLPEERAGPRTGAAYLTRDIDALVTYGFWVEFPGRFSQIPSPLTWCGASGARSKEAVLASRDFGFEIEVPDSVLQYVARVVPTVGSTSLRKHGSAAGRSGLDTAPVAGPRCQSRGVGSASARRCGNPRAVRRR